MLTGPLHQSTNSGTIKLHFNLSINLSSFGPTQMRQRSGFIQSRITLKDTQALTNNSKSLLAMNSTNAEIDVCDLLVAKDNLFLKFLSSLAESPWTDSDGRPDAWISPRMLTMRAKAALHLESYGCKRNPINLLSKFKPWLSDPNAI